MQDLIERLEKATASDSQLDWAILKIVDPADADLRAHRLCEVPPRYTASIDTALTLVPEGCVVCLVRYENGTGSASLHAEKVSETADNDHATPALAVCIAALKARSALKAGD